MNTFATMRFIWQHIEQIVKEYDGSIPLAHYLKAYYRQHPKLGSRDRKMLTEMAYSWYRCSKACDQQLSFEERVANCLKMCSTENKHLLRLIEPIETSSNVVLDNIFNNSIELSEGITRNDWLNSILVQPDLFIRVRKEQEKIIAILEEEEIPFKVTNDCISLPNGTPVQNWFPEYTYVVQDASSQETCKRFSAQPQEHWWDSCSGAGGKSLYLKDLEPLVDITATDSRSSILKNMKERFRTYSHILPATHKLNVANKQLLQEKFKDQKFDNIICDVPCTGSGTWARTPEQMCFFKETQINEFTSLQKQIAVNAAEYLKPGGKLYYITCSVFKKENEEVVSYICAETGSKLEGKEIINGISQKADSMFIAILSHKG